MEENVGISRPSAQFKFGLALAPRIWYALAAFVVVTLGGGLIVPTLIAAPPAWWAESGATSNQTVANDNAVATQGQLKHFTVRAVGQMNSYMPGGAGSELNALVGQWAQTHAAGNFTISNPNPADFVAVSVGQLKWIAYKLHTRVRQVDATHSLPLWLGATPNARDGELANLGQLKTVFNFDPGAVDTDQNQLPDGWEIRYFGGIGNSPIGNPDGDGMTNLQESLLGTNPRNPDTDWDGISDNEERLAGKNPLNSLDAPAKRLAYFPFDQANWVSAEGCLPVGASGAQVLGFRGKGLQITGNQIHYYPWQRSDGRINFGVKRGSVRLWFKPSWSTPGMTGYWSRVFEAGLGWSPDASVVFIALNFQANNPQLDFTTLDGFGHGAGAGFPLTSNSIVSGQWHQIVATYSPTSRSVYLNGQLIATQPVNWNYDPDPLDLLGSGLKFGSDGGQPINGIIDEAETFNYELSAAEIQANYNLTKPVADWDGDGVSDDNLDPSVDTDGDGLLNSEEWAYRTNPRERDTDFDGIEDKDEIILGLLPKYDDSYADADSDGVPNIFEWNHNTNMFDASSKPHPQFRVSPSSSGSYTHTTLSSALTAATSPSNSVQYTIIELGPGTYSGISNTRLQVYSATKKILIVSSHGPSQTIFDGQNLQYILEFASEGGIGGVSAKNAGNSAFRFFSSRNTIYDAVITNSGSSSSSGGGVYISSNNGKKVTLRKVIMANNNSAYGGGIYAVGSPVVECSQVEIKSCKATEQGGGVFLTGSSALIGSNLLIAQNTARFGGGIYNNGAKVSLDHSTLANNSATQSGNSYYSNSSAAKTGFRRSVIWGSGEGSEYSLSGNVTVAESVVRGGMSPAPQIVVTEILTDDPRLRPDGRLTRQSSAIDRVNSDSETGVDVDSEIRPSLILSDLGADEWVDNDEDGLADEWEIRIFGDLNASGSGDLQDNDGISNFDEHDRGLSPLVFNGIQSLILPEAVDAAVDPGTPIAFEAFRPGPVELKFYKFYYDVAANGEFGAPHFDLIDTRTVQAVTGVNTYVWDGMVGSPAAYHQSDLVVLSATTYGDNGVTDVLDYRAQYASGPSVNTGISAEWTGSASGTGLTYLQNIPVQLTYNLVNRSLLVATSNHLTVLPHVPLKKGQTVIDDWIASEDDGTAGGPGTQINPLTVSAREIPKNGIIYEGSIASVENFTVQAYRSTPSSGEVGHVRFRLSRATKVSLRLVDPSLTHYTLYVRQGDGSFVDATDLALSAGTHDLEFKAFDYSQGVTSPRHFSFNKLRVGQAAGLFRVRITWDKDLRTQASGSVSMNKGLRWAYLYVE